MTQYGKSFIDHLYKVKPNEIEKRLFDVLRIIQYRIILEIHAKFCKISKIYAKPLYIFPGGC